MPYYQYLFLTPVVILGKEELPLVARGVPDLVVVKEEAASQLDLSSYREIRVFDQYALWQRKSLKSSVVPQ